MAVTFSMNIPYDEYSLSVDEINELEDFAIELENQLLKKIHDMGLHIVEGIGWCITKFTEEELDYMKEQYQKNKKILEEYHNE